MSQPVVLRPKQIEDLAFAIAQKRCLFLHDPGVGKTPPVCVFLWYVWKELGQKSIWVQPNSLRHKNRRELLRFTEFSDEDVEVLEVDHLSATESQQRTLRKWLDSGKGRPAKHLLAYPQHLERLANGETIDLIAESKAKALLVGFRFLTRFWERMFTAHPSINCLAVDELHMGYGGPDSQNTNAFYRVLRHAEYFVGMTGTLLNGRLDSVFPAIHVIEPRYYGSYHGFRQQHVGFEDDYGRVLMWKNEEKVGQILLTHGRRRTFQEEYGEEDVVFLPEAIEMGEQMRTAYDEFHAMAMLELENGEFLDGSLPGVATIRARQIAGHPETLGLCRDETPGKDERLEIHLTDAKERGESLLIFSAMKPEQERIKRFLEERGRRVGLINSDTPPAKREQIDLAFQKREIDDVVGSPACMGVGFNWEHVDHVIYVSLDYMDVNFLQAYRRASRGTRTKTLRVTIMQYEDSIDSRVLEILKEKSILANKVDPTRPVLKLAA